MRPNLFVSVGRDGPQHCSVLSSGRECCSRIFLSAVTASNRLVHRCRIRMAGKGKPPRYFTRPRHLNGAMCRPAHRRFGPQIDLTSPPSILSVEPVIMLIAAWPKEEVAPRITNV